MHPNTFSLFHKYQLIKDNPKRLFDTWEMTAKQGVALKKAEKVGC